MFTLQDISLFQFRNYREAAFHFSGRIVGLHGRNGAGKTNLLDAMYYLCFSRSYFAKHDAMLVTQSCQGFRLEGKFSLQGQEQDVQIILRENGKKEIRTSGMLVPRVSRFIGKFPCVMVSPDDTELITGGSELRRRFMDMLLSQVDTAYMEALIQYNRLLQQRNTYLKQAAMEMKRDDMLLDTYDRLLQDAGTVIYQMRTTYLHEINAMVKQHYEHIAGATEPISIRYDSHLQQTGMLELLQQSKEKDYAAQRTLCGPHKDDLVFSMEDLPFKSVASQGQRKSLLFALKLAEFDLLHAHKGFAPLLLLDDVFEKLDASRMHHLLHRVCVKNNGQVFLTDTHEQRILSHFSELGIPIECMEINSSH